MTYIDASASDIRAEISTLMDVLEADTGEYFDSQFESGAYIVEGPYTPGEPFTLDTSGDDLSEFRFLPNRQVGKVILPESEYPQQYEMHRKIKWLMAFEATKK